MAELPRPLAADEIDTVAALARTIWQATYPALIPQAQIDFMLADRYAPARIRTQLDDAAHCWQVLGAPPHAFAHACLEAGDCKLDKLYVHPVRQRQGCGAALIEAVAAWARAHGATQLRLQVNRGNRQAIRAYEKNGFAVVEARVFEIGGGFVMDDYVMRRAL